LVSSAIGILFGLAKWQTGQPVSPVLAAAVLVLGGRKRRTSHLQSRFGSEYDRTIEKAGDRGEAESELLDRERRYEDLDIRPLSGAARQRYSEEWEHVQARFVDDPEGAVGEADGLIQEVMRERGYPVDDFQQRESDLSVDHPEVVENYRAGHEISRRTAAGDADTEDLRQAMVHYRALFEELVESRERAESSR